MTLCIAHGANEHVIIDCVRERKPPFSPDDCVIEFSALCRVYGIASVRGDHYAGQWPAERFRVHGISYEPAEKPKSDLYVGLLPVLNSGRIELIDNPRLIGQLASLERRTARSGKDSIDHPPGAHDDLANAVAGAAAFVLGHRPVRISAELLARAAQMPPARPIWANRRPVLPSMRSRSAFDL